MCFYLFDMAWFRNVSSFTLSSLSLWNGLFHSWIWTIPLMQIRFSVQNQNTEWETVYILMRRLRVVSSGSTLFAQVLFWSAGLKGLHVITLISHNAAKYTFWHVFQKRQCNPISYCCFFSVDSRAAWMICKMGSEDSDRPVPSRRLIWICSGRIYHKVHFPIWLLKWFLIFLWFAIEICTFCHVFVSLNTIIMHSTQLFIKLELNPLKPSSRFQGTPVLLILLRVHFTFWQTWNYTCICTSTCTKRFPAV